MKKWGIVALVTITSLLIATGISAATQISLVVNGKPATAVPKSIDGVTYVPLRAAGEMLGANVDWNAQTRTVTITSGGSAAYDAILYFPADLYPKTAAHIQTAVANGESPVCTIDRDGAEENREISLAGIPTKNGYDRDEWPMAMCTEGGAGASVAYVESSDNRGAGAWVGNQLEQYSDGTRVQFVLASSAKVELATNSQSSAPGQQQTGLPFASCAAAREAGAAPVYKGDPGYSSKIDRDGDGVACER